MGNENGNDTDDEEEDVVGGSYYRSDSMRPVPPPEAFQQVGELQRPPEENNKGNVGHEDQGDNEQPNRREVESTAATTASSSAPQRPSLLIRRQSSLFGQLPSRSKSRLFDDVLMSNSFTENRRNNSTVGNGIVAETMMTSATNFSRSEATWLQEDHQSTLIGGGQSKFYIPGDSKSQPRTENSKLQEQKQEGKSSLFGAVMRQFSSSISSSPFRNGRKRSSSSMDSSPQKNSGSAVASVSGGGFRGLMASPSGKSIMNIVNQFNSPFKFQSPSSSHKKRQRRRRPWGDDDDDDYNDDSTNTGNGNDGEVDSFATPKKRRRMPMDEEDENSKPSSNILFPEHETNDSRSSLGGGLVDEHWREAPIVDTDGRAGVRMEVLDWSLATKVRLEIHGGTSVPIAETWIRNMMHDIEEALTYWIYKSPNVINESRSIPLISGPSHSTSSSNLAVLQKSIATTKSSMSRQGSFSGRFDAKPLNGKRKSSNKKGDENDLSSSADRLAKYLTQSVRGPNAKYSRKRVMEENSWWEEQVTPTSSGEDSRERSQRQWQQALRSLFSNYRRRVLLNNDSGGSLNTMLLDTYFFCVGQDHSVLFRISIENDRDSGGDVNGNKGKVVPVVLVSSTSDSFRKQLESNGMELSNSIDGDENFQLLESIQEREARERNKITEATAAATRKNSRFFSNILLSPGVRADLEALRRAQAFGESAGADVMVKVKKSGTGADADGKVKEKLPKAIRVSGWDNVSLFLEVYLNLFGDAMGTTGDEAAIENGASVSNLPFHTSKPGNKTLPMLICPNTNDFGPFEHAALKRHRLFPAERKPASDSKSEKNKITTESNAKCSNSMEIRGILLPCAVRRLLLVARNRILEDEKAHSAGTKRMASESRPKNDDSESSRYIVLHSSRPPIVNSHKEPTKSWIGGMNGSLIFNQGKKRKTKLKVSNGNYGGGSDNGENQVFECSYGKVVSMAVWDTSREEVAACKLDSAFPDDWIHKK